MQVPWQVLWDREFILGQAHNTKVKGVLATDAHGQVRTGRLNRKVKSGLVC